MSFFDSTPVGNILNRFLQDLANVDMDVPTTTLDQLTRTLDVTSQLGLVLFFAPFVALSLPLILIPYVFIFRTVSIARERREKTRSRGPRSLLRPFPRLHPGPRHDSGVWGCF